MFCLAPSKEKVYKELLEANANARTASAGDDRVLFLQQGVAIQYLQ